MEIISITVERDKSYDLINCKIKFCSEKSLTQFVAEMKSTYRTGFEVKNNVLWLCKNKQFYSEIHDILIWMNTIDNIDKNIVNDAINKFNLAKKGSSEPPIISLSQIFKNFYIDTDIRGNSVAVNPISDAILVSVEIREKCITIPNRSWSEYHDFELATYGVFCVMKFATEELAQSHHQKYTNSKIKGCVVTHGPRSCLNNFRDELLEYVS